MPRQPPSPGRPRKPKKNRPTPKTPRTRPSHTAPDEQPTGTAPVPVATSRHNPPVHPAWCTGRSRGRIVLQHSFVRACSAARTAPATHPTRPAVGSAHARTTVHTAHLVVHTILGK